MPYTEDQGIYYPIETDLARFWEQDQETAETTDAALTAILANVFAGGALPIIQWGEAAIPINNDDFGQVAVTFERPYTTPPMVFASPARGAFNYFAGVYNISTTQFMARIVYRETASVGNTTRYACWTAVGF